MTTFYLTNAPAYSCSSRFQGRFQVRRQQPERDRHRQRLHRVQGAVRQRRQGIRIHQNQGDELHKVN